MEFQIKQLGSLEIIEVYDYYDGPKFFTVRNRLGHLFLVYWCDYKDNSEGWLLLPISSKKLDQVRNKTISVSDAYLSPEENYILAYLNNETGSTEELIYLDKTTISEEFLPPEDMYIEFCDVVETGQYNWDHELKIIKDSKNSTPSSEVATEIFGSWTSLLESSMSIFAKNQKTHFVSALPGSLEIKVGSTNSNITYVAIDVIFQTLNEKKSEEPLIEKLYAAGIEPNKLINLFETVRKEKLILEISPRVSSEVDDITSLNYEDADEWLNKLRPLVNTILGTDKIPQADEIIKIIWIINEIKDGKQISTESLKLTSPRQVSYYLDAAENLGVLDKNSHLTSLGHFIFTRETEAEQLTVLANCFEMSECGLSWLKWSKVNSLVDLDKNTAVDFLLDVAPGLSESTAKRRASTLRQWLTKLKPYHHKYK